jgi:hypothetical protein
MTHTAIRVEPLARCEPAGSRTHSSTSPITVQRTWTYSGCPHASRAIIRTMRRVPGRWKRLPTQKAQVQPGQLHRRAVDHRWPLSHIRSLGVQSALTRLTSTFVDANILAGGRAW